MADPTVVASLDVGTSRVVAIIGEHNADGVLEVSGVASKPSQGVRQGVVVNIESALRTSSAAIEEAEVMAASELHSLTIGIGSAHVQGVHSRGVAAVRNKNREITDFEIGRAMEAARAVVIPMDREELHTIARDYVVDGQEGIKDPANMVGVRLEVQAHILTGSISVAQNLIKCVNRAGFRVDSIVLETMAAARAVCTASEREMGVLLIDLGNSSTDLLLFDDGTPCYVDSLPIGSSHVTTDLSVMLKIPLEMAERVKHEAGCCYTPLVEKQNSVIVPGIGGRPPVAVKRRDIAGIIEPRISEVFSIVADRLKRRPQKTRVAGGVVLTGGGANMAGIVDLAQDIFKTSVRIGIPPNLGGPVETYRSPEYANAIGLLVWADEQLAKNVAVASEGGLLHKMRFWVKRLFE